MQCSLTGTQEWQDQDKLTLQLHDSLGIPPSSSQGNAAVHLFVVETQTSGLFIRAYVSLGPPRHAAQLGLAGVSQPASWKIWEAVLPSQPGTGMPYTSIQTFCVAGTRYVGTLTLPPALCISLAAAMKSSVLPPVQDLQMAPLLTTFFI